MTIIDNSHWITTVHGRSGYGSVSRGILTEMLKRNIKFTYENYDWDGGIVESPTAYPFEELKKLEYPQLSYHITDMENLIHHRTITMEDKNPLPKHLEKKTNIFMTGYPLKPHAPPFFSDVLSQYDAVVTPSDYSKSILENTRLDVIPPIYTVPWGYNQHLYTVTPDDHKKYTEERTSPFTFFAVLQWQHLKSPWELINAYLQEFTKEDNVRLLLRVHIDETMNTHNHIARTMKMWSKRLWEFTGRLNPPLIETIIHPLSTKSMSKFYQASDVFIHTSKAEFFGLPVLEAMACGVPTIATNWHAVGEFYKEKDLAIEGYKTKPMPTEFKGTIYDGQFGIEQQVPYQAEIRHKMRVAYEMSQEELKKKGLEQYKSIKHLTWEHTVDKLKEIEL